MTADEYLEAGLFVDPAFSNETVRGWMEPTMVTW